MTITRAEIDDLNDGDMVTVAGWHGLCVSGPVTVDGDGVWMGDQIPLAYGEDDRSLPSWTQEFGSTLQLISRAKPRLYVNHDRRNAIVGDIAMDRQGNAWQYRSNGWSNALGAKFILSAAILQDQKLSLLYDGETGEVVQ